MKKLLVCLMTMPLLFMACQEEGVTTQSNEVQSSNRIEAKLIKVDVNFQAGTEALRANKSKDADLALDFMTQVNGAIAGQGITLEKIEFLSAEEAGRTVFFNNNGNKQLSSDFVPNDPRNVGGTAVPYWIDDSQLGTSSGMSAQATFDALVSTMETWDAVTCSGGLDIPFIGTSSEIVGPGVDVGFVQFLTGFGGFDGFIPGTIGHSGILPATFFESVLGASNVLGVTFTFTWNEDINGDGVGDVAIKEIYINDGFNWQDAPDDVLGNGIYDFETVVLHEVGHGLSQAHFGTAFRDSGKGNLHFSPAALMNAGYTVGRREVAITDEAGHCSNWGNWPNN